MIMLVKFSTSADFNMYHIYNSTTVLAKLCTHNRFFKYYYQYFILAGFNIE